MRAPCSTTMIRFHRERDYPAGYKATTSSVLDGPRCGGSLGKERRQRQERVDRVDTNKLNSGVPFKFVRLAALEEVESSKICQEALKEGATADRRNG